MERDKLVWTKKCEESHFFLGLWREGNLPVALGQFQSQVKKQMNCTQPIQELIHRRYGIAIILSKSTQKQTAPFSLGTSTMGLFPLCDFSILSFFGIFPNYSWTTFLLCSGKWYGWAAYNHAKGVLMRCSLSTLWIIHWFYAQICFDPCMLDHFGMSCAILIKSSWAWKEHNSLLSRVHCSIVATVAFKLSVSSALYFFLFIHRYAHVFHFVMYDESV